MKRLLNNLRSWDDFMNIVLTVIVLIVVKISSTIQYMKMFYYKIRGIPCYMITDHKFGEKICYRIEKENK